MTPAVISCVGSGNYTPSLSVSLSLSLSLSHTHTHTHTHTLETWKLQLTQPEFYAGHIGPSQHIKR